MYKYILVLFFAMPVSAYAQELFTYSEPASNMPVKSFAVRSNNYLMRTTGTNNYTYSIAPEIMAGLTKKLMLHAEAFFGNNPDDFKFDGASAYAKYRFYTEDDVHSHFRLAAYAKLASSNNPVTQEVIDAGSRNSVIEGGIVATKLNNRLALSAGSSLIRSLDNGFRDHLNAGRNAVNFNLAAGRLLLPVTYKDYGQVNVNAMFEVLGQTNLSSGKSFIDFAPSIQFILMSKIRLDAGYRFAVVNTARRYAENAFLLRIEYNFFSVFK